MPLLRLHGEARARPSSERDRRKSQEGVKNRELERVKGIEPSYSAWKAAALPLSYTRALLEHDLVGKPVPPRIKCGAGFFRIML
jgi:hypothetical protein